ncbi:dephospho-CoA kinase [Rhizoctonia solani]|uniref:Dephospho-CoA kinase n=1 Tax=Rhizoctonia solani TaxID=456999 RepID=A0A8H8T1H6_9AGAM|nr:dephospho-CoA kinase [Rhizoctonia solani]QRW25374.1 dephospho-CoA kinase [Rhizoctonia solani]
MVSTDLAMAAQLHELEIALHHILASRCLAIAGFCILIYDHILTFPQEVELIWKQQRSWVSVFFVLNRYITPLVLIVDVYDKGGLANFLSQTFCVNWYFAESAWNLVAFSLIHALVALRVHAIWGRPRWLSITLALLFVAYFTVTTVIAFKFEIDFAHTVAYNPLFRLCFAEVSPYLWTCWLPALIFELFVFVMTSLKNKGSVFQVIKAIEHSKNKVNTPVVRVLYRDGIIYFIVISLCSMFNMMVWLLAPPTLVALSKYFVLCIVPTMGARLVLNLRGSRREDLMPTNSGKTTSDDHYGYEMSAKISSNRSHNGTPDRSVVFVSRDEVRIGAFSPQDRIQLNQIKSSDRYYRLGSKDSKFHIV